MCVRVGGPWGKTPQSLRAENACPMFKLGTPHTWPRVFVRNVVYVSTGDRVAAPWIYDGWPHNGTVVAKYEDGTYDVMLDDGARPFCHTVRNFNEDPQGTWPSGSRMRAFGARIPRHRLSPQRVPTPAPCVSSWSFPILKKRKSFATSAAFLPTW